MGTHWRFCYKVEIGTENTAIPGVVGPGMAFDVRLEKRIHFEGTVVRNLAIDATCLICRYNCNGSSPLC